jgi:COX assembly protein 1
MRTLSRREEETLLKATKERALKECDDYVKGARALNKRRTHFDR